MSTAAGRGQVTGDALLLIGSLLAVAATAGFAGSETVFFTMDRFRLPGKLQRGEHGSSRIVFFLERPERFLSATLAGTNLAGVVFSSLSALYLQHHGFPEEAIFVIVSLFMLIFAETIPKALARQYAESAGPHIATLLFYLRGAVWPFLRLLEFTIEKLQRLLGLPKVDAGIVYSRSDIELAVSTAHSEGVVTHGEAALIGRALRLKKKNISDLMTPRTETSQISCAASLREAAEEMLRSGHKRLICIGDNPDDVRGVIHSMDLIGKTSGTVSDYVRPLPMAPESLSASRLVSWLGFHKTHFAGVVDEYGGFAGVVSVEDLAEELVGPIDDSEKPERRDCFRVTDRLWLIRGRTRLSHLAGVTGFEPEDAQAATIAGWTADLAGGIPIEGDEFIVPGAIIRVIKANSRGALLIRLTLTGDAKKGETA